MIQKKKRTIQPKNRKPTDKARIKRLQDQVWELEEYCTSLNISLAEAGAKNKILQEQVEFYFDVFVEVAATFQINISGTLLRQ